jgi:DeoR/GlpR family transcriptional regulator of sugar metabolism
MLSRERQRQVLQYVRINGSGGVVQIADELGVSPSTVRRDLADLSGRGLLTRVHGGAAVTGDQVEGHRAARVAEHIEQKRRIGQAAAGLVVEGGTVLISGGTTTEMMLPFLGAVERLIVLTNGLNVAAALAAHPTIEVVVLGGVLRKDEMSLLGPTAGEALKDFHVDTAFCGVFGIDAGAGVFGADINEVSTDRRLLASAQKLVVLADSSKFSTRGPVRLADVDQIDTLLTDDGAPPADVAAIRARGVKVIVCPS